MKTLGIAILVLMFMLVGCDNEPERTFLPIEPFIPSEGFYSDSAGSSVALWPNGVMNIVCREHALLPYSQIGPCGQRDVRHVAGNAAFRGRGTGATIQGTLCAWVCDDTDIQSSGTFTATWTGDAWHVETDVTVSDGCRSASATTQFEAR